MRLKLLVSLMILATFALLIAKNDLIGPIPHRPATRAAVLAYSERALGFLGALIVTVTCAGVGSIVLVRRAKQEYSEAAMNNMKSLIEGAIQDHKKDAPQKDGAGPYEA